MSKSIGFVLILLTFKLSLVAQEIRQTQKDSMTSDPKKFLIRWGNTTLGYSLSADEEIIHKDDHAIIIASNGHPDRIIATYSFNPAVLSSALQLEFVNLKTIILDDFSPEATQEKFHAVPQWLASLCKIEALVLSSAELSNLTICDSLSLQYLDLRKVRYTDRSSVLETIGNLKNLQIFVHDESFSTEDLSRIKEKLPNVKFASKPIDK